MEECACKIVLVGGSRCGKSSLVRRFVGDSFQQLYTPTGFERHTATYCVGGCRIHFTLWDTSGTSAYDTVRPLSYKDAGAFLLCFNIGQPDTLDSVVDKWHPEIRQHSASVPVVLCGCQSDARSAGARNVTSEQALAVCRRIRAATYVESSCLSAPRSARDAFEIAALAALGKLNKNIVVRDLEDERSRHCALM